MIFMQILQFKWTAETATAFNIQWNANQHQTINGFSQTTFFSPIQLFNFQTIQEFDVADSTTPFQSSRSRSLKHNLHMNIKPRRTLWDLRYLSL